MKFIVFINTTKGRTIVDEYGLDEKTFAQIQDIYRGDYVKVDAYNADNTFVRSVFLDPEGYQTNAKDSVQAPFLVPTSPVGV